MQRRTAPMFRRLPRVVVLLAALGVALGTGAAEKGAIFNESGVAIRGYDPVAYFTEREARLGKAEHTHTWQGATWRFASAANRDAFAAEPQRYAPQYGGYCAYAASNNYLAPTDPHAWTVHEDKLYLNFSKGVRSRWERDIPGNVARGDANWPGLQEKR